jgi:hypothetical protein
LSVSRISGEKAVDRDSQVLRRLNIDRKHCVQAYSGWAWLIHAFRRTFMKRTLIYSAVIAALFPTMASLAIAADNGEGQGNQQLQEEIYGSQLMSQQERIDYRAQMKAAKTDEERAQLRQKHQAQMQARAEKQGVTLPNGPPMSNAVPGMRPGTGMGGHEPAAGAGMIGPGPGMMGGPGSGIGPDNGRTN